MLSWCFFFKQKTAYEMRISDWSSDVCSSDLNDFFPDGTCSYSQAAHEIAQAQGWNGDRESALNAEMASAINAGQLPTYDRHTGLRLPADGRREFMGLVNVDDVNGWLESRGALYR